MPYALRPSVVLLVALGVPALGWSAPLPSFGQAPYELVGTATGSRALTVDPAGLAFGLGGDVTYAAVRLDDRTAHQLGLALHLGEALGLGLAGEYAHGADRSAQGRLSAGLGLRLADGIGIGLVYHQLLSRADERLDGTGVWDLGATARLGRWAWVGLRLGALNRPWLPDGTAAPAQFSVAAGLRPLGSDALVLGTQWDLIQGVPTRAEVAPPVRFTLTAEPIDGLALLTAADHRLSQVWFGIGIELAGLGLAASSGGDLSAGKRATARDMNDLALVASVAFPQGTGLVAPTPRTVHIALEGDLLPRPGGSPLALAFGWEELVPRVLQRLAEAARDPEVHEVVVSLRGLSVGLATLEELHGALRSIRDAGKPVTAVIGEATDKEYYVASAATVIRMDPVSWLVLDGLRLRTYYLRDTLAKVGVRVDAVAIGEYKSAPEQFTRSGPSPAAAAMNDELADALFAALVDGIAAGRSLAPERVRELMRTGIFSATEAREAGLVDEFTYEITAGTTPPPVTAEGPERYDGPRPVRDIWGGPPVIAVVPLLGTIVSGRDGGLPSAEVADAGTVAGWLTDAADDPAVAAIVLRIDSGGGDIAASEFLWRAVREARSRKPVIASLGDLAASGAYYVAVGANRIFADRSTLTGSIGVFALLPDVSDLLDLLGVEVATFERGGSPSFFDPDYSRSPAELNHLRTELQALYRVFVARVAEGRGLPDTDVEKVAGGRVHTGAAAVSLRLVDSLGGLADAVAAARVSAGLERDDRVEVRFVRGRSGLSDALTTAVAASSPLPGVLVDSAVARALRRTALLAGRPTFALPFVPTLD